MADKTELNDELRPEYDETLLKNGIRGKYAKQYAAGTNVVRLAPDVAASFPTEEENGLFRRDLVSQPALLCRVQRFRYLLLSVYPLGLSNELPYY